MVDGVFRSKFFRIVITAENCSVAKSLRGAETTRSNDAAISQPYLRPPHHLIPLTPVLQTALRELRAGVKGMRWY